VAAGDVPAAAVAAAGVQAHTRGPRPRVALQRHRRRQQHRVPVPGGRRPIGQEAHNLTAMAAFQNLSAPDEMLHVKFK
jgi:hypothetical protein